MKKNDIFLIIIILLIAAGIFSLRKTESADTVQIYKNNKLYCELPLDKDKQINIDGKNVVTIKNGEVYMQSAKCPDLICVKQKPLSESGRDIICLPNAVLVRVTGKTGADAVAG